MSQLKPATITFDENNTPYSTEFGDSYFSRADGLAETRYVFIEGSNLVESWQDKENFIVAETGFGSGLNFLATWLAWQQDPHRPDKLHFISIEKHPVYKDQLATILSPWTELAEFTEQLIGHYPPLTSGFHTLCFNDAVTLTLCFMDIGEALLQLEGQLRLRADIWYLDGFAPAKNPAMWQLEHIQKMACLSKPGARLATFSAASMVRKNLMNAGFNVSKRKGFGKKREMLVAHMPDES